MPDKCEEFHGSALVRRQVREFTDRTVPENMLTELFAATHAAPSVGNSKPWRIVRLESVEARETLSKIFGRADAYTRSKLPAHKLASYNLLNVGGFLDAPIQLSFFADTTPEAGSGQGAFTQPDAFAYSAVIAMHTMWLKATELGLGFNWCSTLYPKDMKSAFAKDHDWVFIGHAAVGWTKVNASRPKSVTCGFQADTTPAVEIA